MDKKRDTEKIKALVNARIVRELRMAKKESQFRFWARFGVTQSRGSRFEQGTEIPSPIGILLKLYFDGIVSDGDLWRARRKRKQPGMGLVIKTMVDGSENHE